MTADNYILPSRALEDAQVLRRGRARIAAGQGVHLDRPGMSSLRLGRPLAVVGHLHCHRHYRSHHGDHLHDHQQLLIILIRIDLINLTSTVVVTTMNVLGGSSSSSTTTTLKRHGHQ